MMHRPVQSSLVTSVAYDPEARVLEVRLGDRLYRAEDVPAHEHERLIGAESVGRAFNALKSSVTFTRVDPEAVRGETTGTDGSGAGLDTPRG